MALVDFRYGALHVVQHVQDRDWITRLLRQIDPRLFLELQRTFDGEDVWCVVEEVGGDQPPVTVYEWRDGNGRPLPYPTEQIVEEFRRRAQQGLTVEDAARIADERNRARIARIKAEQREHHEAINDEFRRLAKRSQTPHRGVHLRMARDKMRARGEKV